MASKLLKSRKINRAALAFAAFGAAGSVSAMGGVSADTLQDAGESDVSVTPSKDLPNTYWFDADGNALKEKASGQSLQDNDGVSDIDGYTLNATYVVSEDDTANGLFADSELNVGDVINIYSKNSAVEAHTDWVEDGTNKVLKDSADGAHPDDDDKSDIDGYTLVSTSTDEDGNIINTYTKTDAPSTAHTDWVDEQGNTLKDSVDGSHLDDEGDDIDGYTLVSTSADEDGNIINTYTKTDAPSTAHTDAVDGQGDTLKDSADGAHLDEKSDTDGYTLVSTSTDEGDNINTDKKEDSPSIVHTDLVDEQGDTLKDSADGAHLDDKSDTDGYTLVSTSTDEGDNINTDKKEDSPSIVHTDLVDEQGDTLKDSADGVHLDDKSDTDGYTLVSTSTDEGDNINTDKKEDSPSTVHTDDKLDIDGYTLVSTSTDEDGNTDKKEDSPLTVHTDWGDEQGNKLKDRADGAHLDDGGDDIEGYELVSITKDDNGNIINTYKKTDLPSTVHTDWVDEQGNKLKDRADGAHLDDEGDDIKGYELVSTSDEDGNIINTYKAVTAEVVTSWVDSDGNPLTGDTTGSAFGEQKKFDGRTLVDVRISEDGKHKYYVYKNETPTKPTSTTLPQTGVDDRSGNAAAITPTAPSTSTPTEQGNLFESLTSATTSTLKDSAEGPHSDDEQSDIYGTTSSASTELLTPTAGWIDEKGNTLKDIAKGANPDGKSDIDGHTLATPKPTPTPTPKPTPTPISAPTSKPTPTSTPTPTNNEGPHSDDEQSDIYGTTSSAATDLLTPTAGWIDEKGNTLKDIAEGSHPDGESDIDGNTLASSTPNESDGPHSDGEGNAPTSGDEGNAPTSGEKELPQTGVDDSSGNTAAVMGTGLLGLLGIAGLKFKHRKDLKDHSSK